MWSLWLSNIFPLYLIDGSIKKKQKQKQNKKDYKMCVLIFSTKFV